MLKYILLSINILCCLTLDGIINLDDESSGSGEEEYHYDWQHCKCWQADGETTTVKVPVTVTTVPNGTVTTTVAGAPITTMATPITTDKYYDYDHCACFGSDETEEESSGFTTKESIVSTRVTPKPKTPKPWTPKSVNHQAVVTSKSTTQQPTTSGFTTQQPTTHHFTTSLKIGNVLTVIVPVASTPKSTELTVKDANFKLNQVLSGSQPISATSLLLILCSTIYWV
ncbi:hypothetical protein LCDVSa081L [Lymphocystis disease virus 3]|uniref:Uncharacterized protein n=1 Tax=Lymphocystis disease virus 3 TaxID=2560566 RepID=A0A1B2RVZ6_9VIRU|nr:hypothetical protein BZK12_gp081 [Lymphocystis disease virus Sa]AOC55165.1 hypothetical protein LCDVSa081L [Lymphocystis disease virus 3]